MVWPSYENGSGISLQTNPSRSGKRKFCAVKKGEFATRHEAKKTCDTVLINIIVNNYAYYIYINLSYPLKLLNNPINL